MVVNEQSAILNNNSLVQRAVIDAITTDTDTADNTTTQTDSIKSSPVDSWNLAYSLDYDLKTRGSNIEVSFQNATEGVTYSQYTSISLLEQEDILKDIQSKLLYIRNKETSTDEKEAIRKNVISQLNELDEIANDSSYNDMYYLQESSGSADTSVIYSFRVSEIPAVTLDTKSIQSNSEGLGLTDLKNIEEDKMLYSVAHAQSDVIESALETIKEFQKQYNNLQQTFKISMSNLSDIYGGLQNTDSILKEIDYDIESRLFDKSSILKQSGDLFLSQANMLPATVVDLLK